MFSLELFVFLFASLISVGLIYFQVPKSILFVLVSILLALLVVLYGKLAAAFSKPKEHRLLVQIGLLISAFFVQLLLIATGGFFSAFIIVLHLFTIAVSMLLTLKSSISFLLFSVGVLCSMIFFDPLTVELFKQDPWSFLLHGVSFLVVIPLIQILVSTYHLKEALAQVLTENLKTKEMQDDSIFRGIGEFVLILNDQLQVIFANEAIKKSLHLESNEIIGKDLFSCIPLDAENGGEVNRTTLSIDQAITDRSAHIVRGFSLAGKQSNKRLQVIIQVRPIYEANGVLKQIVLVITPDRTGTMIDTVDLNIMRSRRALLMEELERELAQNQTSMQHYLLLMGQIEDALLYQQIEGHGIVEHQTIVNSPEFFGQFITKRTALMKPFGVQYDFVDTQEALVRLATATSQHNYSLYSHIKKSLIISVDSWWLMELSVRVIRLFELISLQANKQVLVRIGFNDSGELAVVFAVQAPLDLGFSAKELLVQNYGTLQVHPALHGGSGLEGVLIAKISSILNYPLSVQFDQKSSILYLTIILPHPAG